MRIAWQSGSWRDEDGILVDLTDAKLGDRRITCYCKAEVQTDGAPLAAVAGLVAGAVRAFREVSWTVMLCDRTWALPTYADLLNFWYGLDLALTNFDCMLLPLAAIASRTN